MMRTQSFIALLSLLVFSQMSLLANSSETGAIKQDLQWPSSPSNPLLRINRRKLWDEFLSEELYGLPYYKEAPASLVMTNKVETLEEVDDATLTFGGCGGISVINFNRQKTQKALLVSAAHCLRLNDDQNNITVTNIEYTKSVFQKYDARSTRILYRSYLKNDILIMEIDKTYEELEDKGIYAYELASPDYYIGEEVTTIIRYTGRKNISDCTIKGALKQWPTGLKDQIVTDCKGGPGSSGTPLVRKGTKEIIGVVHSGRDREFMLFAPLAKTMNCFDDKGELDVTRTDCVL